LNYIARNGEGEIGCKTYKVLSFRTLKCNTS